MIKRFVRYIRDPMNGAHVYVGSLVLVCLLLCSGILVWAHYLHKNDLDTYHYSSGTVKVRQEAYMGSCAEAKRNVEIWRSTDLGMAQIWLHRVEQRCGVA